MYLSLDSLINWRDWLNYSKGVYLNSNIMKNRKLLKTAIGLVAMILVSAGNLFAQSCPTLVWSDEFDGTSLNLSNWDYQLGDGCQEGICGWGNSELQYYQAENVAVSNGTLKITARKERVQSKAYTSGRIRTAGLHSFSYGRIEARMKLPAGQGLWSAFWMLSENEPYGGWPQSGEIDIMEFLGQYEDEVLGTIHYGEVYPNNQNQGNDFFLKDGSTFTNEFHVFAIDWEPGVLRWYVDGELYSTKTSSDVSPFNWPFDGGNQMYVLLNLAVGGTLPGSPDASTPFPSTMEVDYVRVYDTSTGYLSGDNLVSFQEQGASYTVHSAGGNSSFSWSVPAGATIVSGANSNSITVDWGDENSTGDVTCVVSGGCNPTTYSMYVTVEPSFAKAFSLENFDDAPQASLTSTSGTLTVVSNPDNGGVNPSANSGQYVRDAGSQYDVIAYTTTALGNADAYSNGEKKFYLDLYTNAPIGTTILIQLESDAATPDNYPGGRHSRFQAVTSVRNGWERMEFAFLDRPDMNIAGTDVTNLLILFAPNSSDGSTYTYDNLDSYNAQSSGGGNLSPSVSVTSPADGASFDEGSTVSISANASDADGSVTSVEFFVDGVSIGTDNTSPYSVNWTIGVGSYSITAQATDDQGATTLSSAVSVTGNSIGNPLPMVTAIATSTSTKGPNLTGDATITVTSSGAPVAGAVVAITWSGDYSGTASGTTDAAGAVSFSTGGVRNAASFTITINSVTKSGYVWDQAASEVSKSTSGAREALGQASAIQVTAFPNPMQETLSLQLPANAGTVKVQLLDLQGRALWNTEVSTPASQHTLHQLPAGVYVLQVQGLGWQHQQRIVKE